MNRLDIIAELLLREPQCQPNSKKAKALAEPAASAEEAKTAASRTTKKRHSDSKPRAKSRAKANEE